ncbi:hypothetical protein [Aquimarina longa]|nr:hypothetical protein [Aquimarina longa]
MIKIIINIISPAHSIESWIQLLTDQKPKVSEFVGQKGNGKTIHLTL